MRNSVFFPPKKLGGRYTYKRLGKLHFMYKRRQYRSKRASRALVSKTGNFHMTVPSTMKIRLKSTDTVIQAIGLGFFSDTAASSYGPPTSSRLSFDLFYPRGKYFVPPGLPATLSTSGAQPAATAFDFKFNYPTTVVPADLSPDAFPDSMKVTLYPDQMQAMGFLYKYARVERVDFTIKFSNLGTSAKSTPSSVAADPHYTTAHLNHTMAVLPRSQYDTWGQVRASTTYSGQLNWDLDSPHADHIAGQIAEMPGSARLVTSQDGNREIVTYRNSIDLTQRMAGDSVRQRTWMTSKNGLSSTGEIYWEFPDADPNDPILAVLGTSSLIDERRESIGRAGSANNNDFWLRWSTQVSVNYHITFWEVKTPTVTVN